jgi:hypothetical protein
MNIIILQFQLDVNLHISNVKPRIYFPARSMNKLRDIVGLHMIPFSMYKLSKGKRPKQIAS